MSGITEYGFVRKTLQEILTSMKQNLRSKLGEDWNVATGSPEDQIISVFAEELDQGWQGLEGAVSSNTIDGSEGIYLDDVLSRQGVYRKGRTASSGRGILFSNYATVGIGTSVTTNALVSANNNLTYNVTEARVIDNFTSCYKLSANQLSVGASYDILMYNTGNTQTRSFTWTVTTESNKDQMLRAFAQYVNEVVLNQPSPAYYNSATRTVYVGFNSATNLPQPFLKGTLYVQASPRVGSLGHILELSTTTLGFNPLSANGLISINPTYVGYESVTNGDDFNAGSDVQTDAEYRLTAVNIKETSVAGTVDSIVGELLKIEGVVDAYVYENPTENFLYDVSSNTVCEPYTYNVAVLGGEDSFVAQVILDKSPANTKRYGLYSANATDVRGQSVSVNFTRCSYYDVEVEVSYKTKDGSALTETEKANISSNLATAAAGLRLGDIVPPSLFQAVVFQSVAFSRLKGVSIRIRDLTEVSPVFTDGELTADYDEKPRVLLDKVSFIRT